MTLGGKLVKFDIIGVVIIIRGALRTREMADSLIDAVRKSNVALVKELIGRGVDVNGVDDVYGYTALDWAAQRGFLECAKVLLEANADVNRTDDGWTPLHNASYYGPVECAKVWWCDTFSFCVDEKTISHFCCAAPYRLEGQRECQNKHWRFTAPLCRGRTLSVR